MIGLTTFAVLLSRHARQQDLCIGIATANRGSSDIQSLIGFFVNMLVIRVQAFDHKSYRTLLKEVRQFVLAAQANQDLPFERIVERLAPQRDPSYSPLYQVVFGLSDLRSEPAGQPELAEGLTLEPMAPRSNSVKSDLSLDLRILADHMEICLAYNTDLFERKRIVDMAHHFQNLQSDLLLDPEQPIGNASMLDESTRQALLQRWQVEATNWPEDTSLMDLLERKVAAVGDAPALILKNRTFSYKQLWQRSGKLAAALYHLGVRPGHTVGLMVSSDTEPYWLACVAAPPTFTWPPTCRPSAWRACCKRLIAT
jgi:non-ribosomal peptide synthetase component F